MKGWIFAIWLSVYLLFLAGCSQPAPATVPTRIISLTGISQPSTASFDRVMTDLMTKWQIVGGALAVVKDGRLVLARGYGLADLERGKPVQPDSLFRIASISKPITAAAILKLVEEGILDLDARALHILDHLQPPPGATVDSRVYEITIRQLLQHSGGWNRDESFDPMLIPERIALELGAPEPASAETIIRFMLGQPLDFQPGTQYAYSNFGYSVLGRVIEKVTGQTYDTYIRNQLLEPLGITRMRLGRSLLEDRAEGEVHYYDYEGAPVVASVFPSVSGSVPRPYGGFYLEAMDAHGGWIASTIDLVRFVTALDGSRPPAVVKSETVNIMVSRPALPIWERASSYYGMGWFVRPAGDDADWWHTGSLPGTAALLVRAHDGVVWTALFDSHPKDYLGFIEELDTLLWQAAGEVTQWPARDLFEQYMTK